MKKLKKLLFRVKRAAKEKGIHYVARAGIKRIIKSTTNLFWYYYYTKIKSRKTFLFQGVNYRYFYHKHNNTWGNERAVEIPIIQDIVKKSQGKRILEVGNVLSRYFRTKHDVLDKYEKADNVINEDAVNFQPSEKYNLIVSVSTIEHVGWDEYPREPNKILKTIEHLKNILSAGGKMIVTLPLGYNSEMDKFLKEGQLKFDKRCCLKRITRDSEWVEVSWDDVCGIKYGEPFPCANGLVVAFLSENKNSLRGVSGQPPILRPISEKNLSAKNINSL